MTNTKIIDAGVLPAAGADYILPTKQALDPATTLITIEAKVTNGAIPEGSRPLRLELHFCCSNDDLTANAASAAILALNVETKTLNLHSHANAVTHGYTKPFVPTGANLYVWFTCPNLPAAGAVDVWLNENV